MSKRTPHEQSMVPVPPQRIIGDDNGQSAQAELQQAAEKLQAAAQARTDACNAEIQAVLQKYRMQLDVIHVMRLTPAG